MIVNVNQLIVVFLVNYAVSMNVRDTYDFEYGKMGYVEERNYQAASNTKSSDYNHQVRNSYETPKYFNQHTNYVTPKSSGYQPKYTAKTYYYAKAPTTTAYSNVYFNKEDSY